MARKYDHCFDIDALYENPEYSYKERIPATWRLFHTQRDDIPSLTPGSIRVMGNILRTLAETVTPII